MMSEFDQLKDDAEKYAKDHPDQVHKGEQDAEHVAESKLGIGGDQQQGSQQGQGTQQDQGSQQDQQGQGGDGNQNAGQGQQSQ
jgi:hypothetical protein